MGNYEPGSDIDIAIFGNEVLIDTASSLRVMLEDEGHLPYFVDIVDYSNLTHKELKEQIDRMGKVIYGERWFTC